MRRTVKDVARKLAPRPAAWLDDQSHIWKLVRRAKAFRRNCERLDGLESIIAAVLATGPFRASQKKTEILELLRMLEEIQPATLCEIGAKRGGTLLLFSQVAAPDARILSIDLK